MWYVVPYRFRGTQKRSAEDPGWAFRLQAVGRHFRQPHDITNIIGEFRKTDHELTWFLG
jgi:hypothetical protein